MTKNTMNTNFETVLKTIFQAITILSPTSFSFAGKAMPEAVNPDPAQQYTQNQSNPLITSLMQTLYQYCYIRRFNGQISEWNESGQSGDKEPIGSESNDAFVQSLSQANSSRERWEAGWQIYRVESSGQITAQKGNKSRLFWPGQFITPQRIGGPPQAGDSVMVYFPGESQSLQPGFYFVFGETVTDQTEEYNVIRFYWGIQAEGIADLIRFLTERLNRYQVPFRFKCPIKRNLYSRLDGAVLYLNKRYYQITAILLAEFQEKLGRFLLSSTPLFTKKLSEGLSLAEDPGTGDSFGQSRCRLLAEAIWNTYAKGYQTVDARLEEVRQLFHRSGLDFERPYLNAGSVDLYDYNQNEK